MDNVELGQKVREIRTATGLGVRDFAKLVGVGFMTLSRVELAKYRTGALSVVGQSIIDKGEGHWKELAKKSVLPSPQKRHRQDKPHFCPICNKPSKNSRASWLCDEHKSPENIARQMALKKPEMLQASVTAPRVTSPKRMLLTAQIGCTLQALGCAAPQFKEMIDAAQNALRMLSEEASDVR